MKKIAILNQKGGVGKSTSALAIGAGLIKRGKRVLFVDLDAQGNLSFSLGADTSNGFHAMEVIRYPETIKDWIQHTDEGDILASSPMLSAADSHLAEKVGKEYRLKEALDYVHNDYDYCIIDTPPSLSILTVNALTACNGAIIPAQADSYSLQGISQLNKTIIPIKKYCNPDLSIMGIVLTRYNSRAIISREVADLIDRTAKQLDTKLYKTKIRECTALKESQAKKQNIFDYAPKSNASLDYEELINEILAEN